MSRSPEPATLATRLTVAAAAIAVGMVTVPLPTWGETRPGTVRDLTTPVTGLHTGISSVDGTVTVEGTRDGAKARIDATVLFSKDSAVLRPGARDRIRQVAKEFSRTGPGKVLVVGYTDDLGPADHGLRLSIRRAGAVASVLADLLPRRGYPMTAVGKGEQEPAVPNTSEANRRKNRRVVITLDRANPARAGSESRTPPEKVQPRPEPTAATTSPTGPPVTASPTATAAPTRTASPRISQSPTQVSGPSARAPADGGTETGWRLDPVLLSNLFLATVLLAAAVVALRRRSHHGTPGSTPTTGSETPSPGSGSPDAAPADRPSAAAGRTGPTREDGPRPEVGPSPDRAGPPDTRDTGGARDLHNPTGQVTLEFAAQPHPGRPARQAQARPARTRDLDADLRDWHSDHCDLPRLSLLGPVTVRAHGTPIARRRPFYTELLTFLALRPHGATPDQVADAFTLTPARVRNDIKVLRDWLGSNPRTGRRHLPDARDTAAGRARGLAVYQVEDLLIDLDLFQRLLKRVDNAGSDGHADLDRALRLVRGRPFDQLRPHGWEWLYEGDRVDLHTEAAIQRASDRAAKLRVRAEPTSRQG